MDVRGFQVPIWAICALAMAFHACGEAPRATPEAPEPVIVQENAPADAQRAPGATVKDLKQGAVLRLPMADLAHMADRSYKGLLTLDMGKVAGRKYINGGWRSGWSAKVRKDGDADYFEASDKTARIFFKHRKDGFEKIQIRARAAKKQNKVTFYLNDKPIGSAKLTETWETYTLDVPSKLTRDGENQLMLRFRGNARVKKRAQAAHIDSVHVLPAGADLAKAPKGPASNRVSLGGVEKRSLTLAGPQTYTFRTEIPTENPQLGFYYGARQPGVTFSVEVSSDTSNTRKVFRSGQGSEDAGKWNESVISLSEFAGQVVEISMLAEGSWDNGQFAAWGEPGIYADKPSDKAQEAQTPDLAAKNVLVYLIDTMRYDKFSVYNDKTSVETPNLDAFAKDATIFDHAYDNENWTKPSCATILTGLYPSTHKTKQDSSKLPRKLTMMPEHFKTKGFRTGSFIANGYVSDAFGFKQGWDSYTNYIREGKVTDADRVVNDALKWIDKDKSNNKRFFAYLQTIDPHVPYSPPKAWRTKYWNRKYRGPIRAQNTGNQLAEIKGGKMKLNKTDKEYLQALYDAEVAFNDHNFGRLIEGLKERGLYENTVILVIADHGEEFWDHGLVGHGHSLYEEMIHSPMFLRYPNKVPTGRRVSNVVQMVDVAPTLFDIADIEPNEALEGVSVVSTLDGVGEARPYAAITDFLYRKKSIRSGRYKWITTGVGGELYDVIGDKNEKKNLIKKHPIARAYMRGLFGLALGADEKTQWWQDSQEAKKREVINADMADIDDELKKQLESMGYIDDAKNGAE